MEAIQDPTLPPKDGHAQFRGVRANLSYEGQEAKPRIRYRAMIAEEGPWTTTTARFMTREGKSYRTKADARRALAVLIAWWMEHILAEFEDHGS
jgi:hypothetical protein